MNKLSRFRQAPASGLALIVGGLGLSLTACQSGSDKPATTTASPTEQLANTQPTNSPGTWYRQYRALLPGSSDSITLHLQSFGKNPGGFTLGSIGGFYADASGQPNEIRGEGSLTSPDSITLKERSFSQTDESSEGPIWRLKQTGALLIGTRAGVPVRLRLAEPLSGVAFISRVFSDSVPARPSQPQDTLFGRIRLHALLPVNGSAKQTLQTNLLRGLRGDTLDTKPVPELAALWQQQRTAFAHDYQEEVTALLPAAEEADTSSYRPTATLAYEQETSTQVLWNAGNLLSIGFFSFDYSGGAHGNYGTTVRSYDTRTGRALRYQDIFQPGSEKALERLLGQYARPALGLKPAQPLSDALFENSLPATQNVYLTSGGVVFVYTPYEVASFAQGEIRVFVPFSALKPWLKTGLPISSGVDVDVVRK